MHITIWNKKNLWAKNYKNPFRSNLKLIKDKLIASNQDNNLIFLIKKRKYFKINSHRRNTIKNEFVNNLSLDEKSDYF